MADALQLCSGMALKDSDEEKLPSGEELGQNT